MPLPTLADPKRNGELDQALGQRYVASDVYQQEAEYARAEQRRCEEELLRQEEERLQQEEKGRVERWFEEDVRAALWLEELKGELKEELTLLQPGPAGRLVSPRKAVVDPGAPRPEAHP